MEPAMPARGYVMVFLALVGLTAATVGLAYLDLGPWHATVGLTIAGIKALLIALYFMHVRHATGLVRVFAVVGLFWLGILMALTITDYATRAWLL